MMTEAQYTEIRDYLLSKKLPVDILLEVQDHFISQINEIMKDRNLNFETAFEETKESWNAELEIDLPFHTQTKLLRTIRRKQNVEIFRHSLSPYIAFVALCLILANFSSVGIFKNLFAVSLMIIIVLPLLIYFLNYRIFTFAKNYKKAQISVLQNISQFISIPILYTFIFLNNSFRNSEQIYYILNGRYQRILNIDQRNATILCITIFGIVLWFIFSIKKQLIFIKKVKELKPFLQNLQQ